MTSHPRFINLESAAAMYEQLRKANPWLPHPDTVSVEPFSVEVTPNGLTAMQLRVYIDLPTEWTTSATEATA